MEIAALCHHFTGSDESVKNQDDCLDEEMCFHDDTPTLPTSFWSYIIMSVVSYTLGEMFKVLAAIIYFQVKMWKSPDAAEANVNKLDLLLYDFS